MKDYFAEFLLNPSKLTQTPKSQNLGSTAKASAPVKHHVIWALVATAIGFSSWKISQWVASHRFLNQKTES